MLKEVLYCDFVTEEAKNYIFMLRVIRCTFTHEDNQIITHASTI